MWAEAEPKRLDSVRKMLKLTKGWEEAREHALKVSSSDFLVVYRRACWVEVGLDSLKLTKGLGGGAGACTRGK